MSTPGVEEFLKITKEEYTEVLTKLGTVPIKELDKETIRKYQKFTPAQYLMFWIMEGGSRGYQSFQVSDDLMPFLTSNALAEAKEGTCMRYCPPTMAEVKKFISDGASQRDQDTNAIAHLNTGVTYKELNLVVSYLIASVENRKLAFTLQFDELFDNKTFAQKCALYESLAANGIVPINKYSMICVSCGIKFHTHASYSYGEEDYISSHVFKRPSCPMNRGRTLVVSGKEKLFGGFGNEPDSKDFKYLGEVNRHVGEMARQGITFRTALYNVAHVGDPANNKPMEELTKFHGHKAEDIAHKVLDDKARETKIKPDETTSDSESESNSDNEEPKSLGFTPTKSKMEPTKRTPGRSKMLDELNARFQKQENSTKKKSPAPPVPKEDTKVLSRLSQTLDKLSPGK